MADPDILKVFNDGPDRWNAWRAQVHMRVPDLSNETFSRRYICGYDLSNVLLCGCNLDACHLQGTSLVGADLRGASLKGASIEGADFTDAVFGYTTIDDVILLGARGLGKARHLTFSSIDYATLKITANMLKVTRNERAALEIELFIRSAGVPDDMLSLFRQWADRNNQYWSCFISYSWADKEFADLICAELTASGVTSWMDSKDALPGDHLYDTIDRAIRAADKVLLCCSSDSLNSWWVDSELDRVLEKERALFRPGNARAAVLIPLDLDGYLQRPDWQDGKAATLRTRLAGDFRGWKENHAKFEHEFERLLKALRRPSA